MDIIGHRGARNEVPENTRAGFAHLRSLGIHQVELDVRLTKDNQLVVLHDTTLKRTTNQKGKVKQYTADELQAFDASYGFKAVSANAPPLPSQNLEVPRLNQVLEEWPELESIQLEVKTTDKHSLDKIAERLNFLIDAHRLQQQAIITSSDTAMLRIVAHRFRHIQRGFVAERFRRDPIGISLSLGCKYLVIDWRKCSESLIQDAREAGLNVSVWTVNKPSVALSLYEWGANSIITDEPTLMQKLFSDIHPGANQ